MIHGVTPLPKETTLRNRNIQRAAILLACLGLTACNTVQGVGRDVQSVGKAVERTAD